MKEYFDIPIVLFIFLRKDTSLQIIDQLRQIRPKKIYILADAGRNEYENQLASECRKSIENAIDWECKIIKNYAEENRGVFAQIGMGAKWVFEQEEKAIFLEDDNLPELTFFDYCKGALSKYEDSERILWICGTNYLEKCNPSKNASVFASKHLMPCGWASWSRKFLKYYDFDLHNMEYPNWKKRLKEGYEDSRLYKQQFGASNYRICYICFAIIRNCGFTTKRNWF